MKNRIIEEFYRKYRDSLMLIACTYTHDEALAEDLVHTAFLKALVSYEAKGSFLYWANTVMRHDFYKICEKNKRIADIEEFNVEEFKAQDDILAEYVEKEEKRELYSMISMLPLNYREVMVEYVYIGRTTEDIARERKTTPENIRKIRSRAKKMLQKMAEVYDD